MTSPIPTGLAPRAAQHAQLQVDPSKQGSKEHPDFKNFSRELEETEFTAQSETQPSPQLIRESSNRRSFPGKATSSPTASNTQDRETNPDYSHEVTIGDTAIAFAGRAIVGPSATVPSLQNSPLTPVSDVRADSVASLEIGLDQLVFAKLGIEPNNHPRYSVEAFAPDIWFIPATKTAAKRPGLSGLPTARAVGQSLSAPAVTIGQSRTTTSALVPARSNGSSPPQSVYTKPSSGLVFAQLIAAPSEYRLVIRGQRLNTGDREEFINDINIIISQLGLPHHPITVVLPEREV